jgi:hypothetical protein
MGVAGTGKTEIARRLADVLGASFVEADAFHSSANVERMRLGIGLTDEDRCAGAERRAVDQRRPDLPAGEMYGHMVVGFDLVRRAVPDRRRLRGEASRFDAQRHELDRRAESEAVERLVLGGESGLDRLARAGPADGKLATLAVIAQERDLCRAAQMPVDAFDAKPVLRLRFKLGEDAFRLCDVDRTGARQRAAELGLEVCREQPVGAEDAGRRRDHDAGNAQQFGECRTVQRPRAAEGHQRELARIVAALDRDDTHRADHVVVDNGEDAPRRILQRQAERPGDAVAHCGFCRIGVKRHAPAEQFCRKVAKHDMGVRHRRSRPPRP